MCALLPTQASSASARCAAPCTCSLTGRAGEQGVKFSNHPEPYTDRPAAELCIINTLTRQETSKYGPTCSFQSERDCASAGEKRKRKTHCFNSSGVTDSSLTVAPTFVLLWKLRRGSGEMRSVPGPLGSVAINRVSLQTASASKERCCTEAMPKGEAYFPQQLFLV